VSSSFTKYNTANEEQHKASPHARNGVFVGCVQAKHIREDDGRGQVRGEMTDGYHSCSSPDTEGKLSFVHRLQVGSNHEEDAHQEVEDDHADVMVVERDVVVAVEDAAGEGREGSYPVVLQCHQ